MPDASGKRRASVDDVIQAATEASLDALCRAYAEADRLILRALAGHVEVVPVSDVAMVAFVLRERIAWLRGNGRPKAFEPPEPDRILPEVWDPP